MRKAAVLMLLALAAGCVSGPAPQADDGDGSLGLPAARPDARIGRILPPVELGTVLGFAEPNVAVAPDGTVYVASAQDLALWKSADGGRTFEAVGSDPCSFLAECPLSPGGWMEGPHDGHLAVLSDGTLARVGLRVPANLDGGFSVPFQRSDDAGRTWTPPYELDDSSGGDRPWILAHPNDTIDVAWGHTGQDRRFLFSRSVDGGATWSAPERAASGWPAGPPVADPVRGVVYLPHVENGTLRVAARDSDGQWTGHDVALLESRVENFPILAVDAAGQLFMAWAERRDEPPGTGGAPSVWLSRSLDGGLAWSEPLRLSAPGRPAVFPWVVAGDAGRIAVAWYAGDLEGAGDDVPNLWRVRLATSTDADAESPTFAHADVTPEPIRAGRVCTSGGGCSVPDDRTLGDFFEMRLLPDGLPVLAFSGDAPGRGLSATVYVSRVLEGTPLRSPEEAPPQG